MNQIIYSVRKVTRGSSDRPRGARYLCWPLAHFRVQMKVRTQLLQLPVQPTALPAWLRQRQLSEESPGKSMFSTLAPELDFHTVTPYHILLSFFIVLALSGEEVLHAGPSCSWENTKCGPLRLPHPTRVTLWRTGFLEISPPQTIS